MTGVPVVRYPVSGNFLHGVHSALAVGPQSDVVGIHHNSGERNGKRLSSQCCIAFELKDGQVIDGREHFYDQANWDDCWF